MGFDGIIVPSFIVITKKKHPVLGDYKVLGDMVFSSLYNPGLKW